ncbi:SDR family NAD(P)-dependent oxidoreductase [Aurantiacibacter atlanticus]
MEVNLRGLLLCNRALLSFMVANQSGSAINIASFAGAGSVSPTMSFWT